MENKKDIGVTVCKVMRTIEFYDKENTIGWTFEYGGNKYGDYGNKDEDVNVTEYVNEMLKQIADVICRVVTNSSVYDD